MSYIQSGAGLLRRLLAKRACLLAHFRNHIFFRRWPRLEERHGCRISRSYRDAIVANSHKTSKDRNSALLKRLVVASVAFVGLVVPGAFAMAVLTTPPARLEAQQSSDCDRNLAGAHATVAAMRTRIKRLRSQDEAEICAATQLYFIDVVKARAVTALCKSGFERERDLRRFDADVAHINDAIAACCL